MFDVIQKWLMNKLGINNCLNLNFNNLGERFKDGVLFARLLQKYKVIPDCYVHIYKKTNFYAICLNNMKNINVWLQFLDISVEDRIIHEIACGQSLPVSNLLYLLYFKLEMLKHQILNNIDLAENDQLDNIMGTNHCKGNSLKNIVPKLFCCLEGIQYTAIDILKLTKNTNVSKGNVTDFIQHNMNCFYDLFMHNLSSKYFKNEFIEKSNKLCKSIMFNILNTKEENNDTTNNNKTRYINIINNLSLQSGTEINKTELTVAEIDSDQIIRSIFYTSQDDLKNVSSTSSLDERFIRQNIFNEYLQHTGEWSSEYLNIDTHKSEQNILSKIVKEVLSFEYGTSEIKCIEIKKTHIAGVIDKIPNVKALQLIIDSLESNEILSFTADDALFACLNAYKEEMKISLNEGRLYQVLDEDEDQNITVKQSSNIQIVDSDSIKSEVEETIENDSINSISNPVFQNISDTSLESSEKLEIKNKITQTPDYIPEPDYNNPNLSPMAFLGKLIDERNVKNHDLQIGDVINCIGEFIKKNQGKNGWVLLEFNIQPLHMALLEYKLTGKIPHFGKEICKHSKKMSYIVPEYEDTNNNTIENTYLTHCIKIIKHREEISTEKWYEFFEFYQKEGCIKVLKCYLNNIKKQPKKAADILVGMILGEEYEQKSGKIFKLIRIYIDDNPESAESKNDLNHDSKGSKHSMSTITTDDKKNKINANHVTHKFQLLSTDLSWTKGNLTNYTYTALYLCDMWETMEHSYIHQIKELLNSKFNFFNELKMTNDLIIRQINHTQLDNGSIMELIKKYENESHNLLINNNAKLEDTIFELQTSLWDEVDNEFEQITHHIKHTIGDQWAIDKNNTLNNIYKELLDIELKRTTITLNFLNRYYGDISENKINEFVICTDIVDNNDNFQTLCLDTIGKFEMYMYENYEVNEKNYEDAWTQSILTEKYRFINQVNRFKARMLLDKTYLDELIKVDHHLGKMYTIYQLKINDINKLCELLKCAADAGKNIKGHIEQISGIFYVNQLSVDEIFCKQIFHTKEKFNMNHLRTIVNELLDYAPKFKLSIDNFIDVLNITCKTQHMSIYPKTWPTNDQFHHYFLREIFGSNVTTIDWRDFVIQCMELPYPTIEQLLFYRKLFKEKDIGDETITTENFETIKLWFENESNQYNEAKWLLCDIYQFKNRINYSAMLLAFCKDKQPWMGLGKSFSLIFDLNPFEIKLLTTKPVINQSNLQDNKSENKVKDIKQDYSLEINISSSSHVLNKEFFFNSDIMTWFLIKNLKLYIEHETLLGIIDISQIVQSVFAYIQTLDIKPTVIDLFRNEIMDDVYSTVYKFQAKELTEVAKDIVIKYNIIEV